MVAGCTHLSSRRRNLAPLPVSGGASGFSIAAQLPPSSQLRPAVDWDAVLKLRSAVARELEKVRNAGEIGAPLDAEVDVYCAPSLLPTVAAFGAELRFIFITSAAHAHAADARPQGAAPAEAGDDNTAWVVVRASSATKCVRCWHKQPDSGADADIRTCVALRDHPARSR